MEVLIFQSGGHSFAISASLVQNVSIETSGEPISFSRLVLGTESVREHSYILLNTNQILAVDEIGEITQYRGEILPVPGYIFASDEDWLAGILWDPETKILLLNSHYLQRCIS